MTNRNELERLLAAATEGPWDHTDNGIGDILISGSNDGLFENFHFDNPKSSDDAALICFLRNNAQHYLSLMDEVERLRCENEGLREVLTDLVSWFPKKPSEPEWRVRAGPYGADDAISAARQALGETHDR